MLPQGTCSTPMSFTPSSKPLRKITGTDNRKEKRAASDRLKPSSSPAVRVAPEREVPGISAITWKQPMISASRSEEHTSELQSRGHLVCRLLLEKKKKSKHVIEAV